MRPRLYLLLKVLLCFLLLYCFQGWIAAGYRAVLQVVGSLLLDLDGVEQISAEVSSVRIIAFLALVLSTSGVRFAHRFMVLLVGFAVFVGIDLVGFYLGPTHSPVTSSVGKTIFQLLYSFIWSLLADLLLPVLIWLAAFERYPGVFSARDLPVEGALRRPSFSKS